MNPRIAKVLRWAPWLLVVVPAIYQCVLLGIAIAGRMRYPYDLEWMEGGLLHHALRIQHGEGIYVPPSVDFIPYLYTPLYPAVLAIFGHAFGLGYGLGRAISVVSLIGIGAVAGAQLFSRRHQHRAYGPVFAGFALSLGLFAASYPFVEGWYDLVRSDSFFLLIVTAGVGGLTRWASSGTGLGGHARVAAGAALLALSFFVKQTGFLYVALGGMVVLAVNWRRLPAYIATAGIIGLGGVFVLNRASDGWFWIYVRKIHGKHDFADFRYWASYKNIAFHFPAMTAVIIVAFLLVGITWIRTLVLPPQARPLLLWAGTFVVSSVVGAVGWGTEFAHFNAYMPALLHGALAAGAAVPAVYACVETLLPGRRPIVATITALVFAIPLAWTCYHARWQPKRFIPTKADVAAGDRLIKRLAAIDGDIWMPSHPWYVHLAGKTPHVHRMGIKDVTWRQPENKVAGLDDALAHHMFAAVILDNVDLHNRNEAPLLNRNYRPAMELPGNERPHVYTGAPVVPQSIWVPIVPAIAPAGARTVFDFETPVWDGWQRSGPAWGNGPVEKPFPGEGLVTGGTGARFASSMHGGDPVIGRMTSPPFLLDGGKLTLRLGGNTDETKCRVELWVADKLVATAGVPRPGGSALRPVTIDVSPWRDQQAKLVLVDDSAVGHLIIDDVNLYRGR